MGIRDFFSGLFPSPHSLILSYDPLTHENIDEMEQQLEEVSRFYRFEPLSALISKLPDQVVNEAASVTIRNPRKSFLLRALPILEQRSIPFTLFVRPDCVGMNRLPWEEELDQYYRRYADRIPVEEMDRVRAQGWREPQVVESFLQRCRRDIGPMPVQDLDPTSFFVTWGKLLEIPPPLREFGIYIDISPMHPQLREGLAFARTQLKAPITLAYSEGEVDAAALQSLGLKGCLTTREGMVRRKQDPWALPIWRFQAIDEGHDEETPKGKKS